MSSKVTAKMTLKLYAGDVLVAETNDVNLWQSVFAAINAGDSGTSQAVSPANDELSNLSHALAHNVSIDDGGPLSAMAKEIGVSIEILQGACAPESEAPFIHLDPHCWEAVKKNFPKKGPGALPQIAVAGALLALWKYHLKSEPPTITECQAVLKTVHTRDSNPTRSLKNTEWLQARGGKVIINPAHRSEAVKVAKSYCTKQRAD